MSVRRRLSLGLFALGVAWSPGAAARSASAQSSGPGSAAESAVEAPTAPVMVDGITLFRVRGISSYPAERRAAEIADRIREVAANRALPVESITIQDTAVATFVIANGRRLFGVLDGDAELEGLTRQVLAQAYQARVAEAITNFRRDREASVLWRHLGNAAIATVVFVLLMVLGRRTSKRLRAAAAARYRSRIHDVQVGSVEIVRGEQLWAGVQYVVRIVATLVAVGAGYLYLNYVLRLFPWTRGLGRSLSSIVLRPLSTLGTGFVAFVPDLVFLIVLAVVTRFIVRLVRLFFQRVGDRTVTVQGFEPEWAAPTGRMVSFALVAFAIVIAYPYIPGSGSEAFKGIGVVIGLMFSLGSASVIGNLVAGLGLAFRGAFRVGDRVRIGEHVGEVAKVQLLTTYLRSPKNEQIVVPNSLILNSEVVNYSALARDAGLILHTNVGIGYETPWRQVEAILIEAARRTPGLRTDPEPFVLQRKLGDFAIDYELNAYTDDPGRMLRLYSALHRNILDAFNEYGIQIMTPAYESDPEQPKIVPREQWFTWPAVPPGSDRVVDTPVRAGPVDVSLGARGGGETTTTSAQPPTRS
jgi:small-conductance mechanosensitive channel